MRERTWSAQWFAGGVENFAILRLCSFLLDFRRFAERHNANFYGFYLFNYALFYGFYF